MSGFEGRKLHLIGAGGAGMSGIAEVLLNMGYRVTGSDLSYSETVKRLEGIGENLHRPSSVQSPTAHREAETAKAHRG